MHDRTYRRITSIAVLLVSAGAVGGAARAAAPDQIVDTDEDLAVLIPLDVADPARPTWIIAPPAAGALAQADGTPITAAWTQVTDPGAAVWFIPAADENGAGYATIRYAHAPADGTGNGLGATAPALRGAANTFDADAPYLSERELNESVTWMVERVLRINVAPAPDAPTLSGALHLVEDTPTIVSLAISDPDLDHEGDAFTIEFRTVPNHVMRFYQVLSDDVTIGDEIFANETVTNSAGLFAIVPDADWNGQVNTLVRITDQYGLTNDSVGDLVQIYVQSVNDAPALPPNNWAVFDDYPLEPQQWLINGSDDLPYAASYTLTFTTLPQNGTLYFGGTASENAITPTNNVITHTPTWPAQWGVFFEIYYLPNTPWTPAAVFDAFACVLSDGEFESPVTTHTIEVLQGNRRPVVTAPSEVWTVEDTPIEFELTATDADGDVPIFSGYVLPAAGTLERFDDFAQAWFPVGPQSQHAHGVRLRYTPAPDDYTAAHAPLTLTYGVRDLFHSIEYATIPIHISAANDAPRWSAPSSTSVTQYIITPVAGISVWDDALDDDVLVLNATVAGPGAAHLLTPNGVYTPTANGFTLTGTLSQINDSLSRFYFVSTSAGAAMLTLDLDDGGSFGEEDPPVVQTAAHAISVQIAPWQ